jgi:hypothetical protein
MDLNNPQDYEAFKVLLSDKEWRIENLYYIKDKHGKKIKFKRNEDQRRYNKNAHNRNLNLKARQKGFTTDACIDSLDDVLFNAYFDAGIIADDIDNAKSIFVNKVKFAYDNLPEILKAQLPASTDREGELRFPHGSSISVDTSFRGGTLRRLHVSEFGKISIKYPKKAQEIITGAFEAVPLDGRIDVESTAEGMAGAFYDMYTLARKKKDDGAPLTPLDFKLHFNPWHTSSEYRLDPTGVTIPPTLAKYFAYLKEKHGVDLDDWQKAWYVKKEEQQKQFMKREYPSYTEEAFMNSGRPVFDPEQVSADIARAEKLPVVRGRFDHEGKFQEDPYGPYKIFKRPEPGRRYASGADIAEGLETGDFSTQTILDKKWEQVAAYCDHIHPDLFGGELIKSGKFYNESLLAPEVNNHGLTTLTHITNKHYKYIYMRQVLDERSNEYTAKAGWQTNVKTKPMMLDEFLAAYRDKLLRVNDVETLREMLTLTYEPNGDVVLNGKDRVVSFCIALQAIKQVHEGAIGAFDTAGTKKTFAKLEDYLRYTEDEYEETRF